MTAAATEPAPIALDDADWLVGLPEDSDPVVLEEGDDSLALDPPDDWQVDAHEAAFTADPHVDVAPGASYLNGFSACDRSVIGTFRIPGTDRYLAVRREVAALLIGFAAEFHVLVEDIDNGTLDDWGYACRAVRGSTTVISFHAPGIAIDLNALRHPMGRIGTFTARQVAIIRALCRKYGLRWGGDFSTRPDPMHVEVILSRTAALALVKRLQTPPAPVGDPVLYRGMTMTPYLKSKVKDVQRALNLLGNRLTVDGDYGPSTEKVVRAFQTNRRSRGLAVDGHFTQDDWNLLRVAIARFR